MSVKTKVLSGFVASYEGACFMPVGCSPVSGQKCNISRLLFLLFFFILCHLNFKVAICEAREVAGDDVPARSIAFSATISRHAIIPDQRNQSQVNQRLRTSQKKKKWEAQWTLGNLLQCGIATHLKKKGQMRRCSKII